MIPTATTEPTITTVPRPAPDALPLGRQGRLYLLSWLRADLVSGVPITVDEWREAWGRAADYQTVCNALEVLS